MAETKLDFQHANNDHALLTFCSHLHDKLGDDFTIEIQNGTFGFNTLPRIVVKHKYDNYIAYNVMVDEDRRLHCYLIGQNDILPVDDPNTINTFIKNMHDMMIAFINEQLPHIHHEAPQVIQQIHNVANINLNVNNDQDISY